MTIGINWQPVWKAVWKKVWRPIAPVPPVPPSPVRTTTAGYGGPISLREEQLRLDREYEAWFQYRIEQQNADDLEVVQVLAEWLGRI